MKLLLLRLCLAFALLLAPLPARAGGADRSANITTAQATLSTTAAEVLPASLVRRSVLLRNTDASISIYVGVLGVTSSTGFVVKAGETLSLNTRAAIYAVAASGTPVVHTLCEND